VSIEEQRRRVPVRRIGAATNGADAEDWVAVEEPLEIRVGYDDEPDVSESLVVTMRTPGFDEELARGLLFTEGLIDGADDLLEFVVADPNEGAANRLEVRLRAALRDRLRGRRRHFYASTSCGICGKAALESLRARAPFEIRGDDMHIGADILTSLPAALAARQPTFTETGGIHAAALFRTDGEILAVREDVGRHNALDKLVGAALREGGLPISGRGVLVSGRASFEIVEKARMAGCPLLAAVGAPSSLAIEAAWESGITLVGFLRDGRFNVYAVPARINAG